MTFRQSGLLRQLQLYPTQTVAASFVIVALFGSILLLTPWASQGPRVAWVDAFFTATSAVCVTGLTVVDTGTTYTFFGQLVILGLISLSVIRSRKASPSPWLEQPGRVPPVLPPT